MKAVCQIKLRNIPTELKPGDTIDCTVAGAPFDCKFLAYSARGAMFGRKIIVEVAGLYEVRSGVIRPDMFASFKDEFFINDAPGCAWHRTATTSYTRG